MLVYVLICITLDAEITFEVRKLFELLKSYENCFDSKNAKTLFEHENKDHIIDLMFGAKSSYEPLYILFETELNVLRNYLLKNLTLNRIRKSTNRANASMLFVLKKNDSFRLCVDYKRLNALIIKNKCSFLLINETLNRFVSAAYFIKLDFKNAYYRIKIRKSDEWMTTFRIRYDHFEYAIMSFKFVNASVTFQTLINKILRRLINHICVIYLDDILIYFKTREKHWKCVRKMLERLRQFKLYAKLSKCSFMIQMIEFLEYIINNHDVFMNSRRVKVIQTWFEFKTLRELQIFLKFANFYKRFVKFYAKITRALTELLKENKQRRQSKSFIFKEIARQMFRRLIKTFMKALMLIHFNFKNLIRIEIDTSEFVIAAILFQFVTLVINVKQAQWHSIVFYSKKMIFAEIRYETHDQELLSIVAAFQQWRHYFKNSHHSVTILTNHNNLRYFMKTTAFNRRQFRWVFTLAEYNFEIKYRSEKINSIDGSSRRSDYKKKTDDEICLLILQNKLKNIIVAAVNLISVMTRDFEKALTERTKNAFDTLFLKKIDEENIEKFFDVEKNDLSYNVVTQQLRRSDACETCSSERQIKLFFKLLMIKLEEL